MCPPVESCDIVGTASQKTFGKLIHFFSWAPHEPEPEVFHVGMLVNDAVPQQGIIVEALSTVQRRMFWSSYYPGGTPVKIWRPIGLNASQKIEILARAQSYVGRKYGWLKIGAHAVDWGLSKLFHRDVYGLRRFAGLDRYPICSWVVANAYAAAGLTFGKSPGAAQPDDIDAYCKAHPEKYQLVWALAPLS